jgi:putative DNA primase/helicase
MVPRAMWIDHGLRGPAWASAAEPNCQNGALDLRTFTLQPQSAEAFCTLMTETDYVPGATDATWERFITEKLPNPQTRDWVQMGCGYALTGNRREEIMLNFYGPTRGGKTTMAQSLESTLGDYATTVPAEVFMRSRRDNEGEGNRPTLARLKGKRLVVSAEASDHHQLDDGLVKLITGGDPLPATAKYEHPIVFTPEFLWILHGNYLVKVRGDDAAIWNRIRLVPFNVTVKKEAEDPEIKKYLTTDPAARSAIFAWCVEGLRRYRANPVGLKNPPPEVVKATADYRDKMNALAAFIEACCVLEPTARVSAGELRLRYEAWCIRLRHHLHLGCHHRVHPRAHAPPVLAHPRH